MKIKKIFFGILIGLITLLIISTISFSIYFYLMLNYDEQVSERITEDVIVINDLFVSMYLVKTDSGFIAIDTGFFESFIEKGLEYNQISSKEIKYVLLTHSDADHVNNLKIFKNAKVFFPFKEKIMLDHKRQRFTFLPFYSNGFDIKKYTLVDDGAELLLANKYVKCISLPGHTEGSMGFIIDDKYLFSGDAFRIKNGKLAVPFKKQFVMNEVDIRKSIIKVSKFQSLKYIFTSHSGFTADFNFAFSMIK